MLRETYQRMSDYYLLEGRSCFASQAYRMAAVAAETSAHLCLYFALVKDGKYSQDNTIPTICPIIEEAKKGLTGLSDNNLKAVLADAEWLMHVRNALAHPDEWTVILPGNVPSAFDPKLSKVITTTKFNTIEPKASAFLICQINNLEELRKIADEAIKKAENIAFKLVGTFRIGTVHDWKKT